MFDVFAEDTFDNISLHVSPLEPDVGGLVVVETVDGVEPDANTGVTCAVDF